MATATNSIIAQRSLLRDLQKVISSKSKVQFHKSTAAMRAAHIKLSSNNVLVDEKVRISVSGLKPRQNVTLQAYLTESGKTYGACGHYVADTSGRVDTFSDQSHGGTFEGIEPMGLFWSVKAIPGFKQGRLVKADVMSPFDVSLAVLPDFQTFEALPWSNDPSTLAETHLYRSYTCEGVRRISIEENGLYGTLFLPPGEGPFPAVIDMFGFSGGITEFRSALLASRGIAAFSLAFVDYKDLPRDVPSIDLNYFLRGFDWLSSHPEVDSSKTGIVATCVGAGFGLFMTSMRPNVKCLVSVNGTCYPMGPVQVVEGERIVPSSFPVEKAIKISVDTVSLLKIFEGHGNAPIIQGWRHGAFILFIKGEGDQCINPRHLDQLRDALPEEAKSRVQFVPYEGAGHLIDPPYAPWCGRNWNNMYQSYTVWGGSPKPHADAQEDSWDRILEFLDIHLVQNRSKKTPNLNASLEQSSNKSKL